MYCIKNLAETYYSTRMIKKLPEDKTEVERTMRRDGAKEGSTEL